MTMYIPSVNSKVTKITINYRVLNLQLPKSLYIQPLSNFPLLIKLLYFHHQTKTVNTHQLLNHISYFYNKFISSQKKVTLKKLKLKHMQQNSRSSPPNEGFSSLTIFLHLLTLLLIYAYIKEELTFKFIYALTPSLLVFLAEGYDILITTKGVIRAKYLVSYSLLIMFFIVLGRVIKNQGGILEDHDDQSKWLVRHRKCFELLILSMGAYIFYDLINHQKQDSPSVVKSVLLNILSSLSAPLTICSGGACNSIYISTITSILSSFSVPLTLAVPLLNVLGYAMQLVGLVSLYSANKWRSGCFWLFLFAMIGQMISSNNWINWICCGLMVIATVVNAKTNKFVFGKNKKLFKQSIV